MAVFGKSYKGYVRNSNPEWAQAIGKAMLNFSVIEMQTYLWIEELCGDLEVQRYVKKIRPIGERIEEITRALTKLHAGDPWATEAIGHWTMVKDKMANTRNQLAHNPTAAINRNGVETTELFHIGSYDETTGKTKTTDDPKAIAGLAESFGQMAAELNYLLQRRPAVLRNP